MSDPLESYRKDGIAVFAPDAAMQGWARACAARLPALLADPELDRWYRCDRSWFAGVNALPNGRDGGAAALGIPPLTGDACAFIAKSLGFGAVAWDRAQISVAFPGYPRHGAEDGEASFRFRRNRCAAHVDGLERFGDRRRRLSETHSFILGIPLGAADERASPLVLWRGSHEVMRAAFRAAFADHPPERWREIDITEAYVAARRQCFETCDVLRVAPGLGTAYVVHPLALHGVAPWKAEAHATPRAVAYFRPDCFGGDPRRWLEA